MELDKCRRGWVQQCGERLRVWLRQRRRCRCARRPAGKLTAKADKCCCTNGPWCSISHYISKSEKNTGKILFRVLTELFEVMLFYAFNLFCFYIFILFLFFLFAVGISCYTSPRPARPWQTWATTDLVGRIHIHTIINGCHMLLLHDIYYGMCTGK